MCGSLYPPPTPHPPPIPLCVPRLDKTQRRITSPFSKITPPARVCYSRSCVEVGKGKGSASPPPHLPPRSAPALTRWHPGFTPAPSPSLSLTPLIRPGIEKALSSNLPSHLHRLSARGRMGGYPTRPAPVRPAPHTDGFIIYLVIIITAITPPPAPVIVLVGWGWKGEGEVVSLTEKSSSHLPSIKEREEWRVRVRSSRVSLTSFFFSGGNRGLTTMTPPPPPTTSPFFLLFYPHDL